MYPPRAIEFVISIADIGTKDWNHDLYIQYFFNDQEAFAFQPIIIEELLIPYALEKEVIIEIKYPSRKPESITIFLNTTQHDSLENYKIYDELYYKNNSIKIDFD